MFNGQFREDLRDGNAQLTIQTNEGVIKYRGDFVNDKRSGKCDELSLTEGTNETIVFRGRLDNSEAMTSEGILELKKEQISYRGQFKDGQFNSHGIMVHTDTGNTFNGEFMNHIKHGQATFILKEGQKFRGEFKFGVCNKKFDYGKRF